MENKTPSESLKNECIHLAEAFSKIFISVVELDLNTENAITLKSPDTEVVMKEIPWEILLSRYTQRRSCPEDRVVITSEFCIKQLDLLMKSGQKNKSIEVRCRTKNGGLEWMELSATVISADHKKMLITTQNIHEQRLLKSIVERFIYKNCDYFVLLDTKNNSYTRFMGSDNGTNLPDVTSDDYTGDLQRYNNKNVMPYDIDRVTAEMQIDHILQMLENHEEYDFYCDGIPEKSTTIRRKRLQFVYHDKQKGLVLVTRSDITDIYMHEKELNEQLISALNKSQTDALTGIYNQVAIANLIAHKLSEKDCDVAALLFVDVDNFKMVNDSLGHLKGDYLLKYAANSLEKLIREYGVIGRIGGDEFLMFVNSKFCIENLDVIAQNICRIFSDIPDSTIKKLDISCSVGISIFPNDGTDYETLVRKADQALYDSKRHGKNKYCFYSDVIQINNYESMISKID